MQYFTVKAQKEYHAKREVTLEEHLVTSTSKKVTFKNIIYTHESQWSTTNVTMTTTKSTTTSVKKKKSTTALGPQTTLNSFTTPAWPNIFITQKTPSLLTTTSTTTTTLPPSMLHFLFKKAY